MALFKGYIQVDIDARPSLSTIFDLTLSQLREFDRVRTLYKKYIEVRKICCFQPLVMFITVFQYDPTTSTRWIKCAELETDLGDISRAEAIFELGVSRSALAMPELDEQGDCEKARMLYEHLIGLSGHHKVWISYAEFEGSSIPPPHALQERRKTARGRWCLGTQSWHDRSSDGVAKTSRTKSSKLRCLDVQIQQHYTDTDRSQRVALLEAWKAFDSPVPEDSMQLVPCGCGASLSAEWRLCQQRHSASPLSAFLSRIFYVTHGYRMGIDGLWSVHIFFSPPP